MSKRSVMDLLSDVEANDELDPKEVLREKKLKKKPTSTSKPPKPVDTLDEAGTSSGVVFDEIMSFSDEIGEKFTKTIQIAPTIGIGITSNNFSLFRVTSKNGKQEISSYQFTIKNAVIPNMIQALRKIYRINLEKKK
jgi:hypothetical protein